MLPFVFMLVTTLYAGWLNITGNYLPRGDFSGKLQAILTAVMMGLALIIAGTCAASWRRLIAARDRVPGMAPAAPACGQN